MSSSDASLAYVRDHYKVPARRGRRVLWNGQPGTITGGNGPHLIVRLDDKPTRKLILHPTWHIEYLEVLWRCTGCGVWSHARRRPKHHRRFTRDADDDDTVLEVVPGHYDRESGEDSGGYLIACGPFDRYEARKVTPTS